MKYERIVKKTRAQGIRWYIRKEKRGNKSYTVSTDRIPSRKKVNERFKIGIEGIGGIWLKTNEESTCEKEDNGQERMERNSRRANTHEQL